MAKHNQARRQRENAGFTCARCGAAVQPVSNGGYRNHCPRCLWSRHVDESLPGDRASGCGGLMQPVGLLQNRKGKGLQLRHRCSLCGHQSVNRVALHTVQDDVEGLLAFMRQ